MFFLDADLSSEQCLGSCQGGGERGGGGWWPVWWSTLNKLVIEFQS